MVLIAGRACLPTLTITLTDTGPDPGSSILMSHRF
jgi:hypothetical protein